MIPGIQRVRDLCHFDRALAGASLVVTGEGRSDRQTLQGKVSLGVLQRAAAGGRRESPGVAVPGVPVALLSGRIDDAEDLRAAGFSQLIEVSPRTLPLSQALSPSIASENLRKAVHLLPPFSGA